MGLSLQVTPFTLHTHLLMFPHRFHFPIYSNSKLDKLQHSVLEGNTVLVKGSLIYLKKITLSDMRSKNPPHYFTLIYLSNGATLAEASAVILRTSMNFGLSHGSPLAELWHDSAPSGNEYATTTLSHRWRENFFLFFHRPSFAIAVKQKVCGQLQILVWCGCVWITGPSDSTGQWEVPLSYVKLKD